MVNSAVKAERGHLQGSLLWQIIAFYYHIRVIGNGDWILNPFFWRLAFDGEL